MIRTWKATHRITNSKGIIEVMQETFPGPAYTKEEFESLSKSPCMYEQTKDCEWFIGGSPLKDKIELIAPPSMDDIKEFCAAHHADFYQFGDPDNWDNHTVFRVSTHDFPARGQTVNLLKVAEWKSKPKPEKKEVVGIEMTEREISALDELCKKQDLTRQQLMIQALKLYQLDKAKRDGTWVELPSKKKE